MPRIDIKAIVIAFAAEVAADFIIGSLLLAYFARDLLVPGMSQAELEKVGKIIYDTTAIIPWMVVLGTATTVGGAWLAARIARRIPYYHGLAMGIVGIVYSLLLWRSDATWLSYLGFAVTIPASLYGAHLAKMRMPPDEST